MEKVPSKWLKFGYRNLYPLSWSAVGHAAQEGLVIGKLKLSLPNYLSIRYGGPLGTDFGYEEKLFVSNFKDLLENEPRELERILRMAEKTLAECLKAKPGKNRIDARNLYEYHKLGISLMYAGYFFTQTVLNRLKESVGGKKFKILQPDAVLPSKAPIIAREHHAIEVLKRTYRRGELHKQALGMQAKKLAKEFGFVHSEYAGVAWEVEDYLAEIRSSGEGVAKDRRKFASKVININEDARGLIDMAQRCAYLFDEGKTAAVRPVWALRETIKAMGWKESDVMGCFENEFLQWVKIGRIPRGNLVNRARYHVLLVRDGKLEERFGKEQVEKIIKSEKIDEFEEIKSSAYKSIKGQVGFPGKVIGKVRRVFLQKEADEVNTGEILVSSMTTPEFIRGMRKAAAFVTDEGGVLCHAAIIAREMKKPCVIGTKIATKVLKSGQMVEVDANKGVIKILS